MENTANEFFQLQSNTVINAHFDVFGISSYISCIKINGRPILPPLITEERKKELSCYKKKAIEIESKLAERKKNSETFVKCNAIVTSENSLIDVAPNRQSTPARPATLQLFSNNSGRTLILPSVSDSKINKTCSVTNEGVHSNSSSDTVSSQKSTNKLNKKSCRSTIEQRLANEDNVPLLNKRITSEKSVVDEKQHFLANDSIDSDGSKKEQKSWSPLKIDAINSLRVEVSNKDSQNSENFNISMDDPENSSGTLTSSPNLMRQNSYTLLTPSPALLHFLEMQKEETHAKRSQSGRKTWDLTKARKNWIPTVTDSVKKLNKSLENECTSDHQKYENVSKTGNSTSLDGFSVFQTSAGRHSSTNERLQNFFTDDGSTSPSSYSFKTNPPKFQKIKCKIKSRRVRPHKNVPSPKPTDKVPTFGSNSVQGHDDVFVPLRIKEELTDLSGLLVKMKLEHERQKKELEEKQRTEMKELELLFKRREFELFSDMAQESPMCPRSLYSQYTEHCDSRTGTFHFQMMGDGKHNPEVFEKAHHMYDGRSNEASFPLEENEKKRPQSAKGSYAVSCLDHDSRRTKSMDFNETAMNQDTDFDISLQDSLHSRDVYLGNDELIETDTISNISSHSSTLSSDTKLESMPLLEINKCKVIDVTSEEFAKYNEAAAVITAAARGFLTRRLLRTAHVQGLITTLRDAISCATQLHGASDLGESDVDLMKRLGRQIEAAWEAVYAVFFDTDTTIKMQLISSDRERLRSISAKLITAEPKKRISSATMKSLRRKSGSELVMSKSQMANGSNKSRKIRPRMVASYPSPSAQYKLK